MLSVNSNATRPLMTATDSWLIDKVQEVLGPALGAVLGTLAGVWRAQAVFKVKLDALEDKYKAQEKDEDKAADKLDEAVRQITTVATDVKVLMAEQGVINRVNNITFQGMMNKLDVH